MLHYKILLLPVSEHNGVLFTNVDNKPEVFSTGLISCKSIPQELEILEQAKNFIDELVIDEFGCKDSLVLLKENRFIEYGETWCTEFILSFNLGTVAFIDKKVISQVNLNKYIDISNEVIRCCRMAVNYPGREAVLKKFGTPSVVAHIVSSDCYDNIKVSKDLYRADVIKSDVMEVKDGGNVELIAKTEAIKLLFNMYRGFHMNVDDLIVVGKHMVDNVIVVEILIQECQTDKPAYNFRNIGDYQLSDYTKDLVSILESIRRYKIKSMELEITLS